MILVIGDLHIGALSSLFTTRIGLKLQIGQLTAQLNYGLENNVSEVVLTGDIFDGCNPSQLAVSEFLNVITHAKYERMQIHLYHGNHDIDGDNNSLFAVQFFAHNYTSNIHVHTHSKLVKLETCRAAFLPYPATLCKDKDTIVFLHKDFKGTKRDNGGVFDSDPFDFTGAKERNQIWVSGHLHTQQDYKDILSYVGSATLTKHLPWRQTYIMLIDPQPGKLSLRKDTKLVKWECDWGVYRVDVYDQEQEDDIEGLLKDIEYVRIKAVCHNYKLSPHILEDKRVVLEPNTESLFVRRADPEKQESSVIVSNAEWVTSKLPPDIRNSRRYRRRALNLIERAEAVSRTSRNNRE